LQKEAESDFVIVSTYISKILVVLKTNGWPSKYMERSKVRY